ncbi:MAG: glucose dehydrogenase [Planctomycetota bacterium]|nr:MAG: glucose dehydrogenase [Planctomycetota bacterium]
MQRSMLLCGLLAFAGSAANAQLTSQVYVTGINDPTFVTNAGDGSNRLFVLDQTGKIRIIDGGGNLLPTPFLDIDILVSSGGERGLLGLAFHPEYETNGKFYVNYTNNSGATVIAEYRVSDTDPDQADLLSGRILLTIAQPYSNHNGGWIGFGADGYLYIGMGDGGSANDPGNRASNLNVLLGKILRIDVDTQDAGLQYGIPADNPFQADGNSATRGEIWDYGVRNPWRCSFDRETGDFWIADVGQNAWEEINFEPAGQGGNHYGWRCREGFNATGLSGCPSSDPAWVDPVHAYSHALGCSITGGYAYRGCELGDAWTGKYFFSDYCTGTIWYLDPDNNFARSTAFDTPYNIVSFGEDEQGELYFTNISNNTVYKLVLTNPPDKNNDGVIDTCETGCPADLAEPFGTLNIFDIQAYIGLYNAQDPAADLAEPFGTWNIFDIQAYIGLYNQGCP